MTTQTPVLFIHGLWLHSTSWQPWIGLFREAGYDPSAPGWPGDPDTVEEARQNPGSFNPHSPAAVDTANSGRNRGHSLTVDAGWREVADAALAWLRRQNLDAAQ